jgi:hypothetical protein
MRHQAKVQACLLAVLVLVTACGQAVDGSARRGSQAVDPGSFFAGPVAVYGRTLSPADTATLAYLRALRRVDVCGLVNRDIVGKVGEIDWYGTLFAFDECDAAIKVPGRAAPEYLSVEVAWERPTGQPVFTAAGLPVHETSPGSCEFLLLLGLARLPGAPPLTSDNQPVVKTSVIGGGDCPLARRATTALADWLDSRPPPARDAVAAYPIRLAEADPCAVLAVVGGEITRWDIDRGTPYQCVFDVNRGVQPMSVQVSLAPKVGNMVIDGRERRDIDGILVYVDRAFCSAGSIVGPQMQRRLAACGYEDPPDTVIVPTVTVDSGGADCDTVARIAADAAKLYR